MTRTEYYDDLRRLAGEVRAAHGLISPRVTLTDMRRIYKTYNLEIKLWPHRLKGMMGAYFNDPSGAHVMIDKNLPDEQRIFTMAHELKHHLTDGGNVATAIPMPDTEPVEIGAEVFASELIFPDVDFRACMEALGVGPNECTAETIVRLKRQTHTTLPHKKLAKKAEYLGYAERGAISDAKVVWKHLEEELFGVPAYLPKKRPSAAVKPKRPASKARSTAR